MFTSFLFVSHTLNIYLLRSSIPWSGMVTELPSCWTPDQLCHVLVDIHSCVLWTSRTPPGDTTADVLSLVHTGMAVNSNKGTLWPGYWLQLSKPFVQQYNVITALTVYIAIVPSLFHLYWIVVDSSRQFIFSSTSFVCNPISVVR